MRKWRSIWKRDLPMKFQTPTPLYLVAKCIKVKVNILQQFAIQPFYNFCPSLLFASIFLEYTNKTHMILYQTSRKKIEPNEHTKRKKKEFFRDMCGKTTKEKKTNRKRVMNTKKTWTQKYLKELIMATLETRESIKHQERKLNQMNTRK